MELAVKLIRKDIVTGALPPSSRLGIHSLSDRYAIGTTPLREALSRLSAMGLVVAIGQRGFRVADLNRSDLEDLVRTRVVVESAALTDAMKAGGLDWEGDILAALHKMNRFDSGRGSSAFPDFPTEYDELHKRFHAALISACGSPRLMRLHDMLYDQTFRYRALVMSKDSVTHSLGDEHGEIARLVIAREVGPAIEALRAHLSTLLQYSDTAMPAAEHEPTPPPARARVSA
ncbi:MAG: FCD domain-containing protein [Pseudomonadota bacterium]